MEKCGQYRASIGASPIWKKGYGIIWIDVGAEKIITFHPETKKENVYDSLGSLKSIIPLTDGRFIGVYKDGLYYLNFKQGVRVPFRLIENTNSIYYLNEAKCGPDGEIWVDQTDGFYKRFQASAHTKSSKYPFANTKLLSVAANGEVKNRLEKISLMNGFEWSRQTKKFYYIDPLENEILQYKVDDQNNVVFEKVLYTFDRADGCPQSLTIDEEDHLWVILTNSTKSIEKKSRIVCLDPEKMTITLELESPTTYITSCIIGGERLDKLYVTTAYDQIPLEKVKYEQYAGYLVELELEKKGVSHYEFALNIEEYSKNQ